MDIPPQFLMALRANGIPAGDPEEMIANAQYLSQGGHEEEEKGLWSC